METVVVVVVMEDRKISATPSETHTYLQVLSTFPICFVSCFNRAPSCPGPKIKSC